MRIYAIWNATKRTFVKWGVNGGGNEGYCVLRGKPMFFTSPVLAESAVRSFGNPADYKIRTFEEVAK